MDYQPTDDDLRAYAVVDEAIEELQRLKRSTERSRRSPNDRSEKDRWFAVAITDMQKAKAILFTYVMCSEKEG